MDPKDNYSLDTLIREKSFEDLSGDEQIFVLETLGSQEAYRNLREAILEFQREEQKAPPSLKVDLLQAFDEMHSGEERPINALQERRKTRAGLIWKIVAMAAVLTGFVYILSLDSPKKENLAERKVNKQDIKQTEYSRDSSAQPLREEEEKEEKIVEEPKEKEVAKSNSYQNPETKYSENRNERLDVYDDMRQKNATSELAEMEKVVEEKELETKQSGAEPASDFLSEGNEVVINENASKAAKPQISEQNMRKRIQSDASSPLEERPQMELEQDLESNFYQIKTLPKGRYVAY